MALVVLAIGARADRLPPRLVVPVPRHRPRQPLLEANLPTSVARDDGLRLIGAWIAAAVRCAPPANRPLPSERDNCLPYLVRELALLEHVCVIVALGSFGWDAALRALAALGEPRVRPRPRFGHGASAQIGRFTLLGCFHPSQQNTFTGKLTEPMLDDVLGRARRLAG